MLTIEKVEKIFSAISNQTTEGITVADMDGNYVFVNPAFCKMSGYTEEELLKLTVFDMKAKNQDHSSFRDSKEKFEGKPLKVNLQKKDGTEYYTEIIGDVLQIDDEKFVLGTIRDITERELYEREIKLLNEGLEEKWRKRTSELNKTIEQLNLEIEQRTIAEEEANKSLVIKEILLREITHRVKNNMQIISSIVNLQKSVLDGNDRNFLDQLALRIQAMALIHEALYKTDEFDRVTFKPYVRELVGYVSDSINTPNISIRSDIENCSLPLDTATCLGMIIMELITNSLKHAFKNRAAGEINIKLGRSNGDLFLTVADNGVGFGSDMNILNSTSLGMQTRIEFNGTNRWRHSMEARQWIHLPVTF